MRNSQQHIGGGTIIDLYACINVLFVAFWLFSICARPTIVSTIHLFLFGVYVIFGGIILKGNGSRTKVWSHTALSVRKYPFVFRSETLSISMCRCPVTATAAIEHETAF